MPWKAFKVEGEFCVFKLDGDGDRTGKSLGCHSSRKKANRQVAAKNAQENKNMTDQVIEDVAEDKDMHVDYHGEVYDTDEFVPFGTLSFDEYDDGVKARKAGTQVKKDSKVFNELIDNILRSDEVTDVKNSILGVAKEFASRVGKNLNLKQRTKKNGDVKQMSQFMVFKDTEKDRYGFFTTYSNNIRDDDNPPEIIAAESHIRFEKMVDKGTVPPPQLQLWHLPSIRMGEVEVVAYDKETNVAMAAGYFYKEAEPIAKVIEENPDLWGVSHGMLGSSVVRSEEDKTVIVQHITKEISPVPNPFPANRWADFSVLKEISMTIPDDKRKKLEEAGVTKTMLKDVEASNKSLFQQVEELGLERKESDPPVSDPPAEETPTEEPAPVEEEVAPEAEPVAEPATEPIEEETEPAEETPEEDAPPAEDAPVAPFTDNQVTELKNTFEAFGKVLLKEVVGMLQPITDAVTEQKKISEDTLKKTLDASPLVSLQDLVLGGPHLQGQSATKSDQTIVDGRTKVAKDGPEITEDEVKHINSGNPILDMVLGDIIQDSLEPAKPAA